FFILLLTLLQSQPREALLIGNSDYKHITDLDNPSPHIKRLKTSLQSLGFSVITKSNLNSEHLEESIEKFSHRLSKDRNTIGFLYYSGHGCQLDHKGYLIPTDVDTQKRLKIKHHALSINEMLDQIDSANNRVNMLFLDACRDVPTGARGGTKGLGQLTTPKGTLVVYATEAGKIARDNQNFINSLIDNINKPNQSIRDIGDNISNAVADQTNEKQIPVVFSKRLPRPSVVLNVQAGDEDEEEEIVTPTVPTETKYSLTINPTPHNAKVYITNIKPKYRDGIRLKAGEYRVKLIAQGYKSKIVDISLRKDSSYSVELEKKRVVSSSKQITTIGNLMWQDEPYTKAEKKAYDDDTEHGKTLNWNSAISYCKNLSLSGYDDWRLPNKKELQNLYKQKSKLKNVISSNYWSSATGASITSDAWVVNFYDGNDDGDGKSGSYFVRCVRAGQ
ncbi:MAG: hypothetical protein DRG30_06315, partial [Epsilonproteobacteria bacterium]